MDTHNHRNIQNLPKIGPTYSSIDEKQHTISEEIIAHRIKPELVLKFNLNIPGLERKKVIGSRNPETFRLIARHSHYGREGWMYGNISPNMVRYLCPFFGLLGILYVWQFHATQAHRYKAEMNFEYETAYLKMQTIPWTYCDHNLPYMA